MKFSNPYTNLLLNSLKILIVLPLLSDSKKMWKFIRRVIHEGRFTGLKFRWKSIVLDSRFSRESQLHHPLFFDRYKNFLAVSLYWHFVHSEKNQGQFHAEVVPFDGRREEGKRSSMWFRTNCLSNDKSWISGFHRWTKSKERTWILTWSILSMYDSTCASTGPVYELHICQRWRNADCKKRE